MKRIIILAVLTMGLLLALLSYVHHGEPVPTPSEPVIFTNSRSARYEARMRASPAEEMVAFASESATNSPASTNLYARLRDGDIPHVSREQLEAYLAKNRRSVDALIGALRASGDDTLLKEAKERFPNDPRVQFAAAFKAESPEERQQWLEKFKQSDPGNSLANYLLAGEHWKAGQTDQALQELTAASGKAGLDNYLLDFIQNAEEAYRAAGHSDAEAKAIAGTSALLPELGKLRQVGRDIVELAKRYQQAGDESSAQAALQMGLNLGHRLDQSPQVTLIQELVGLAVERHTLTAMDPNALFGETGLTVQNQIDALDARRKGFKELTAKSEPILMNLSDEEVAHYFDRIKLYGDVAARHWVISKAPQQ